MPCGEGVNFEFSVIGKKSRTGLVMVRCGVFKNQISFLFQLS